MNGLITEKNPELWVVAVIIPVVITVFLLMLTLKIPGLNVSLVSFNAYSCFFVGFAAGTYRPIPGFETHLNALVWVTGANIAGLLFVWASIKLSQIGTKSAS
jgi:hypothetical protein